MILEKFIKRIVRQTIKEIDKPEIIFINDILFLKEQDIFMIKANDRFIRLHPENNDIRYKLLDIAETMEYK